MPTRVLFAMLATAVAVGCGDVDVEGEDDLGPKPGPEQPGPPEPEDGECLYVDDAAYKTEQNLEILADFGTGHDLLLIMRYDREDTLRLYKEVATVCCSGAIPCLFNTGCLEAAHYALQLNCAGRIDDACTEAVLAYVADYVK